MTVDLWCASGNRAKLREFQLAAGSGIRIHGLPPVPCPENAETFDDNAAAKALCYSRAASKTPPPGLVQPALIFADDSGLAVDALGGEPGVYSARYAGPEADDQSNNALLLEKLRGVAANQRGARFICCIALAREGRLLQTFQAEVEGRILEQPAGSGGFGYDPLFYFPPLEKSFAELSGEQKWRHSHRGQAFRKLLAWLQEHLAGKR